MGRVGSPSRVRTTVNGQSGACGVETAIMLAHALLLLALGASGQDAGRVPAAGLLEDEAALSRIRSALARPAGLRIEWPCQPPTFRVQVQAHPFFTERPWRWDFSGGGVPPTVSRSAPSIPFVGTPPLIAFDVLPLIRAARKAHTDREAVTEMRRALEEFCSTHQCDQQ
jgi:hypothetical protein